MTATQERPVMVDCLAMPFDHENLNPTMSFWGELSEWERKGATVEVIRDQQRKVTVFNVWMEAGSFRACTWAFNSWEEGQSPFCTRMATRLSNGRWFCDDPEHDA